MNYRTEKRKANVGERILITRGVDNRYSNGDVGVVTKRQEGGVFSHINDVECGIFHTEYEVIVENKTEASGMKLQKRDSLLVKAVPTQDYQETIGFTENADGTYSLNFAKMPGLVFVSYDGVGTFDQLFVHGDFKAEAQRVKIESAVGELTKYTIESSPVIKTEVVETVKPASAFKPITAQEHCDEIIEMAKRDVAELKAKNYPPGSTGKITHPTNSVWFTEKGGAAITDSCEFIINTEKRTVVALIKTLNEGELVHRGIAKCAPTDCFNAHIGKAIALRRALGLEVPAEYLNAPQPTEVRVGDVVRGITSLEIATADRVDARGWAFGKYESGRNLHAPKIHLDIIDDSRGDNA